MTTARSVHRRGAVGLAVVLCAVAVVGQSASAARSHETLRIDWVTIGNAGNPADTTVMAADRTTGYGSVPYTYRITKFDITNTQYAAFLNAVTRTSDPYLLFFPCMDRSQCYKLGSGIARTGSAGNYSYAAQPGRERRPVNYVNLYDAMRLANWMNNGQGDASTETGAYTLLGGTVPINALTVRRNPGAKVFVTSENEWYKAAYYDPKKKRYYAYPAGTDKPMTCALPGPTPNTGNCGLITSEKNPANPGLPSTAGWFYGDVTDVGAYSRSPSPYGTFDQGGNLFQWIDELTYAVTGPYRAGSNVAPVLDALNSITGNPFVDGVGPCAVVRGTDWGDGGEFNAANGRTCDYAFDKFETYGIRLASLPA